jgi:hypothetical protein
MIWGLVPMDRFEGHKAGDKVQESRRYVNREKLENIKFRLFFKTAVIITHWPEFV